MPCIEAMAVTNKESTQVHANSFHRSADKSNERRAVGKELPAKRSFPNIKKGGSKHINNTNAAAQEMNCSDEK